MTNPDAMHVAEMLLRYPACLIATHISPEGDAIGSQLALALALEQRGIRVACYDRDGVPDICRFLPTWERVARELPTELPPLAVFVDADRLERCNLSREQLAGVQAVARVDHHVSAAPNADAALVDTTAAATGELIFALLPLLGAELTPEIATCLLTALMVDTGRFSFSNTTPRTLHIAADLRAAGADLATITEWTWGQISLPSLKLRGRALASIRTSLDGRVAWAVLRHEDYLAAAAAAEDTDGVIDQVRKAKDVEVALLFSERNGDIRVSLRSRGPVDVAAIACEFNGGGHVKAAGITFDGTLEQAVCEVIAAVERVLGS